MYHVKTSYTNAKKQTYNNFLYDSKFEAGVAQDLDLRVKAGEITHYDRQVNLDLIVNDFIVCTYRIDFIAYHPDGIIEYIEAKGYPTPVWKLKWKLFEALYSGQPNTLLTIIQQGKFKRPKLRKVKYGKL